MAKRAVAMVARCRVCHRPLSNPAHAAQGVGPECAKRAARRAAITQTRAYPDAKYQRITRNVSKLAQMVEAGEARWTPEAYALICHWLKRWRAIQAQAQSMGAR